MSKALLYELGKSTSYGRLPLLAKVLWPMLLAASDDQGRGVADTDVVKWHVCPNVNELTPDTINGALQEMLAQGMIILYEEDGRNRMLYQIVRWWEYQKMQWARPSRYAPPDEWKDKIRCRINNDYVEENWKSNNDTGSPERSPEQPPERVTEPTKESESKLNKSKLNELNSSSAAAASSPKPKPKPKRKTSKAKIPEAVRTFQASAHRYPPKAWYSKIAEVVGEKPADLEFWGQVVLAYIGLGWNPGNVSNMLDFYSRREIPVTKGQRKTNGEPAGFDGIRKWGQQQGILEGP